MIYNDLGAVISYDGESEHKGFHFYNNIFMGKDQLLIGKDLGNDIFIANNWYSLRDGFNMYGEKDFKTWVKNTRKEYLDARIVGMNVKPIFNGSSGAMVTTATDLKSFSSFQLPENSPLRTNGVNLNLLYGIDVGTINFNQKKILPNAIGASF